MKRFFLVAVMFTFMSLTSWSQESYFNQFAEMDDVEYIQLDKSMLEAAFKASSPESDVSAALEKVEILTLITIDKPDADDEGKVKTPKAVKKAYKVMKKLGSKGYNKVVQTKDEGDIVNIYSRDLDGEKKEFVVVYDDNDEMIIVIVSGKLNADEAKDMISIQKK